MSHTLFVHSTFSNARVWAFLTQVDAAEAQRWRSRGWTPQLREKNLPLVVDNPRFLILPWITIPNLGSHILSLVRRILPDDWTERYNATPVLIEALALDCYSILRNSGLLGKVMKIRQLLELGIVRPMPLRRARWA